MFTLACSVIGVHLSQLYLSVRYHVVADDPAVSTDAVLFLSFFLSHSQVVTTDSMLHLLLVIWFVWLVSWLVGQLVGWFVD